MVSIFLGSQPIGQKTQTQELMMLVAPTKPDKIELERSLHRWTELSWFLGRSGNRTRRKDHRMGPEELPKSWRLGNRPNLRQMHDDACVNRVPPGRVEAELLEHIRKQRSLTSGASAAGARVHNLPDRPRDISDDGDFHYAVLGPTAASESGKPSAELADSLTRPRLQTGPG